MVEQVDTLARGLAVYGAILGTLSLTIAVILGIIEVRRTRVRVKVKVANGILAFDDGQTSEPFIIIKAINTGQGDVKLVNVGFLLKRGNSQYFINSYLLDLPHVLKERRSCSAYYAIRWFQENDQHDDIKAAVFGDDMGREWKGRITKRARKSWLKLTISGIQIEWSQKLKIWYRSDVPPPDSFID